MDVKLTTYHSFQDEDFVAEKDDGGSPTDDSGEESDASESGDDKEVSDVMYCLYLDSLFNCFFSDMLLNNLNCQAYQEG